MLSADALTQIAKACGAKPNASVVQGIVDNQHWLEDGGIDTTARLCEFLAQACLETDYFRTLREYWGPTAAQKGYEGRKDLGNVVAGDGKKFMGRGIFQCTGRANYAAYGKRLGIDLLKEPERAADPDVSVRIAVLYWNDKGLSAYADRGDTAAISRAINRGNPKATSPANHEADRIKIAKLARQIIKVDVASTGPFDAVQVETLPKAPDAAPVESLPAAPVVSHEPAAPGTQPTLPPMAEKQPGFWAALFAAIASLFARK